MLLSNLHTHSTFCDGKNTPEEIILAAIQKGFSSIGFSGHGYTPYDLRYCMKDTEAFIAEILKIKDVYGKEIEIYLGSEEDAFSPVARSRFEYIIGSSHYYYVNGEYLPIDSSFGHFQKCYEAFGGDTVKMAETYYESFCSYINKRKPDVIGHFDLITKFDELDSPYFSHDPKYREIAKKYLLEAMKSDSIFEVNTGAITRGYRHTPYPSEELLHLIRKSGGRIMLSSDSHAAETIDAYFPETADYLYDLGFRETYILLGEKFIPCSLK